jgi:RHS repeat-associated protein
VITRVEGGLTYTQTFNAENRLVSVTVNSQTTQFIYDGDGNLVKKVKPDGSKTLYIGGVYEVDKTSGGETRLTTGSMFTDKLFTGQREMAGLGIYHFNARFYSPRLGRFLSADSFVPGYANPQNLNRFSYVRNNPVRYVDPSGHVITDQVGCHVRGCPGYSLQEEIRLRRLLIIQTTVVEEGVIAIPRRHQL